MSWYGLETMLKMGLFFKIEYIGYFKLILPVPEASANLGLLMQPGEYPPLNVVRRHPKISPPEWEIVPRCLRELKRVVPGCRAYMVC